PHTRDKYGNPWDRARQIRAPRYRFVTNEKVPFAQRGSRRNSGVRGVRVRARDQRAGADFVLERWRLVADSESNITQLGSVIDRRRVDVARHRLVAAESQFMRPLSVQTPIPDGELYHRTIHR